MKRNKTDLNNQQKDVRAKIYGYAIYVTVYAVLNVLCKRSVAKYYPILEAHMTHSSIDCIAFGVCDVMANRSSGILVLCSVNPVGHRHVTPRVSVFRLRILFIPFCSENRLHACL